MNTVNLLNRFICQKCHGYIATVELHEGKTPLIIQCQICPKAEVNDPDALRPIMFSVNYNVDQNDLPTHEWYKPDLGEQVIIKDQQVIKHVQEGGLLLRPVSKENLQFYRQHRGNILRLAQRQVFAFGMTKEKGLVMMLEDCEPNNNKAIFMKQIPNTNRYQIGSIIVEQGPPVAVEYSASFVQLYGEKELPLNPCIAIPGVISPKQE